jgi:VanZ family protein
MVEIMQLFTPERTASVVDVGGQVAGALAGAVGAEALLRLSGTSASAAMLRTLRRQPGIGPATAIAGIMAGQSLYPFAATLDARTVWNSFKHGAWIPLQAPRVPAWDVMVVGGLIPGAVLGALVVGLCPRPSRRARGAAWGLVTAYGVGLELAKLFIEGRSPNANHALAVGVGALLGVAIGPAVGARLRVRAHLGPAFTAVAAALLVYHELHPFGFIAVTTGLGRIEWLPFTYYYEAEPSAVLVDLGRKVLLGGLLGAALRTWGLGCPAIWTLGFALLLEALQLFLPARYPAVTDVLTLTAGAGIGAALFTRYRALILGRECETGGRRDV